MLKNFILSSRLRNQSLSQKKFQTPQEVVGWQGAVQAQDYLGSLWAIGQRVAQSTEAEVEKAIDEKVFIRSWPLRGTLHFVLPEDIRWMLSLLGDAALTKAKLHYKQAGLDTSTFEKSREAVAKALDGGKQMTREEIYQVLRNSGIDTQNQRGLHILGWLAMKQLICFGPRRGIQHTFVLLDEWIPAFPRKTREESLQEIAMRYFTSHGPATEQDFAWWAGLPAKESREALELTKGKLDRAAIEEKTYWLSSANSEAVILKDSVHLLPAYDEYAVAYKDRSHFLDPALNAKAKNGIFHPIIIVEGKIAGLWKRTLTKKGVTFEKHFFSRLNKAQQRNLKLEEARYESFIAGQ